MRCADLVPLLCALALPACRHAGTSPSPEPCPAVARRANMRFELRGKAFPLAVVDAKVAGEPTLALLDTGAESHVIGAWFARKLALPLTDTERTTTDAAGRAMKIRVTPWPQLEVEGFGPLPERPAMVLEVELMEKLGIGLVVSPQYMVGAGEAVVLDFPGKALWREPESCAFARARRSGRALPEVRSCADPAVPTGYLHYVLPVTVDGEEAALLLDSGATSVGLAATSRAGQALLARHPARQEEAVAASGAFVSRELPALEVKAGQARVVAPVSVGEREQQDPVCPSDGQVGLPLLRTCVLALSHARAVGACLAP